VLVATALPASAHATEVTFPSLPWPQYWTPPPQVTHAEFDVYGAQGADSIYFPDNPAGLGGHAAATIKVVPGNRYAIRVGAAGQMTQDPTQPNGGGEGSEVRTGTTPTSTRLIAAGGGGPGPGGAPGGSEINQYSSIDDGGASWGPPGTVFEAGARHGDGLITISYDPNTFIKSGPAEVTNDNTPTFSFSANRGGTSFGCFDEFTFGACSGPGASHTTEPLADGRHTVAVASTDDAGNSDPTPATRSFRVDTRPPVVRVTGRAASAVATDGKQIKVRVSFKSNERRTSFECRVDKGAYRGCHSPFRTNTHAEPGRGAKHRIFVRGTDAAGNVASPVVVKFRSARP